MKEILKEFGTGLGVLAIVAVVLALLGGLFWCMSEYYEATKIVLWVLLGIFITWLIGFFVRNDGNRRT